MRVMCIDDHSFFDFKHLYLNVGEIYEATGEKKNPLGIDCYVIPSLPDSLCDEYTSNNAPLYIKSRFIPCSDIDETELVNQKPEPCESF